MNNPHSVQLEDPAAIPAGLLKELASHEGLFRSTRDTEGLVRGGPLAAIADALTTHLRGQRIRDYHCTRELEPGYFATHGLRLTAVDHHQADVLERCGHIFTVEEQAYMRRQWAEYFDPGQRRSREGKVWACLTRALVLSAGARPFFEAFGGEAIYMPLAENSSAAKKLAVLGRPVVVEVALPGNRLRSFCDAAWCVLNYHHRRINPDAHAMESEGYVCDEVPPSDVLDVVPLKDFTAAVR
ncbi:hypothetical protein [Roseateles sp.]|uniref:hypothetical protein n=1 Tax=Roseateles sp. TaxID=1971397 RepID=UPI0025F00F68|nr:hypothetical protein [Roseateles sp.]